MTIIHGDSFHIFIIILIVVFNSIIIIGEASNREIFNNEPILHSASSSLSTPSLVQHFSPNNANTHIIYTTKAFYIEYQLNRTEEWFGVANLNTDRIEVSASLAGYAALPHWMRFYRRTPRRSLMSVLNTRASSRNNNENSELLLSSLGYFYGTPPLSGDNYDNDDAENGVDREIEIDIILLDRFTFQTAKDQLKFRIVQRNEMFQNQVEIKLFDMDIEDFIQKNIKPVMLNIFEHKLWNASFLPDNTRLTRVRENIHNLNATESSMINFTSINTSSSATKPYITKLARPVDVGDRYPMNPYDKEGVVIRIGAMANFTSQLLNLEIEVAPLKNILACPKRFKATTVEYIFRECKLLIDWCRFRLIRGGDVAGSAGAAVNSFSTRQ